MIYSRQFIVLLFSIATFSQLSPTIAVTQECNDKSVGLPTSAGSSSLATIIETQCSSSTSDCTVDLTSWSTNGDQNFDSTCSSAGGEVHEIDISFTCPSADADGSTKFSYNNLKGCQAKVCTVDEIEADYRTFFAASLPYSCTGLVVTGTSGGSKILSFSTALFAAVSAGVLFFVNGF